MSTKIIRSEYHLYDEKIDTMSEVPESELESLAKNKELRIIGKKMIMVIGFVLEAGCVNMDLVKLESTLLELSLIHI